MVNIFSFGQPTLLQNQCLRRLLLHYQGILEVYLKGLLRQEAPRVFATAGKYRQVMWGRWNRKIDEGQRYVCDGFAGREIGGENS